jgi:hypothetical protein
VPELRLKSHAFLALLTLPSICGAATRVFVTGIGADNVTLAWGTTDGRERNTIGAAAPGLGTATVNIAGRALATTASSLKVEGLSPNTAYTYSVTLGGTRIGAGTVRTWPAVADSLTFFVIGDFGDGSTEQKELAAKMEQERVRLEASGEYVRFVCTTGDNIYGRFSQSGDQDRDWEKKYFGPYAETLGAIPFHAVAGNHDGNESERTEDLPVFLDNFFLKRAWYKWEFGGGFAEFFALDTTKNQPQRPAAPNYSPGGEQSAWLEEQLSRPPASWRFAVMHHPMFSAGPEHPPFSSQIPHWFSLFKEKGVRVVLAGHEHNFQFSERNAATGNIQFVVSGAGGKLREGSVSSAMARERIAAWSPRRHFVVVRLDKEKMTITPIGVGPLNVQDRTGAAVPLPLVVNRVAESSAAHVVPPSTEPVAGRAYDPTSINFGIGAIVPPGQSYRPLTGSERVRLWRRQVFENPNTYGRTLLWAARDHQASGRNPALADMNFGERFGSRYARTLMSTSTRHGLSAMVGYDVRYVPSKSSNLGKRLLHALLWDFTTLDRNGKRVFNWPRIVSVYGSEMTSAAWMPGQKWSAYGLQSANEQMVFGWTTDILREFLPDIKRRLKKAKKH